VRDFCSCAYTTLSGIRNDRRIIQITAPVQPGNSGSPVLALNGSVVGVVVGKLNPFEGKGDVPQNVNFAVSLGILQSFLNTYAVPYIIGDSENNKNYADIAAEGIRYTVLIECSR
jgi:S1-C subfamily serine protease